MGVGESDKIQMHGCWQIIYQVVSKFQGGENGGIGITTE